MHSMRMFIIVGLLAFLYSCASLPAKPAPPLFDIKFPEIKPGDIEWELPDTTLIYLAPAKGQDAAVTRGDVRVEILEEVYECDTPVKDKARFTLMDLGVFLSVKNNTGHIFRFDKSIIVMEDGEGNLYEPSPAVDLNEVLARRVRDYFAGVKSYAPLVDVVEGEVEEYARNVEDTYAREFKAYAAGVRKYNKNIVNTLILFNIGMANPIPVDKAISPGELIETARERLKEIKSDVTKCIEKTGSKKKNACMNRMVVALKEVEIFDASTVILPGKEYTFFLPFFGRPGDLKTDNARLGLYDMPVNTDAAANPTAREHFIWRMKREEK